MMEYFQETAFVEDALIGLELGSCEFPVFENRETFDALGLPILAFESDLLLA